MTAWFLTSSFFSWWSLESNSQNEWTGTSRKLASSLVWKDLRKHSLTWKRHNGGLDKRPFYWWFQSCWNIYERPPKPPTFWNSYTRTLILDTIMKLSGTIGVTQKTMTLDTHVRLILLQTLNPQERWGTHKKRWPFQPRLFADVIGLVRCSYVFDLHCCSGKVFHFPISILPWFPLHRFIYVDRNVFKTPPAVVLFVSSTDSGTDPHDFEERFLHYKMIQSSNWISSL